MAAAGHTHVEIPPVEIDEAPAEGVAQTLMAVALEVRDLARMSDRLQTLISTALVFDGSAHADHLREFQAIDLLVQRLHGVAIFVESLSELTPPGWRLNTGIAAAEVPLTDLARRLSGLSDRSASAGAGADDGYELFG
jgi:hypothetical protein